MFPRVLAFSVCCAMALVACRRSAEAKLFYVVAQKPTSSGAFSEWIIQGPPRTNNGFYIFTPYLGSHEMRFPIQDTVVTKIGPKREDAEKFLLMPHNPKKRQPL